MIKPTATTCMATSLLMPNRLHASGISSSEPPATPDAPHALTVATRLNSSAVAKSTCMPWVCAAAIAKTVIVIAAPPILTVAPNGMEIE